MFCAPGAWRPGQTPHRIMHHAAMPQRHIALLALGLGGEMPLHGLDGNEVGHHGHGDGDTQKKKQKQCRPIWDGAQMIQMSMSCDSLALALAPLDLAEAAQKHSAPDGC